MIITKLKGGLGNQMFQYAIGRHLSIKKNTSLKLDTTFFNDNEEHTKRDFVLNNYNILAEIASDKEIEKIITKGKYKRAIIRKILQREIPYHKERRIGEISGIVNTDIFNINSDSYIHGVWANEKYFKDSSDVLTKEFTLKKKSDSFLSKEFQITNRNSVSIHIRRGDYLTNEGYNNLFGVLGIEYYNNAISYIKKYNYSPFFYIFTDDVEWTKQIFLNKNDFEIVSGKGFEDYEELQLMSCCKCNIIANSTYSWWGAWLNNYNDKIVVAPQVWYIDMKFQFNHEQMGVIPNNWILL